MCILSTEAINCLNRAIEIYTDMVSLGTQNSLFKLNYRVNVYYS